MKQGRWDPGHGSCRMSLNSRGHILKAGGSSFCLSFFNAAFDPSHGSFSLLKLTRNVI